MKYAFIALLFISEKGRNKLVVEAIGRLAFRQGDYAFIPPYKGNLMNKEVNIEVGVAADVQLYDIKNDPAQKINIAKDNPEKVKEMQAAFKNATKNTSN